MKKATKETAAEPTLETIVRGLLSIDYFQKTLTHDYQPGEGRFLVVTGGNATGKSFFASLFGAYVRKHYDYEGMVLGMKFRTMSGIERAFVFSGSEDDSSTGYLSVGAILSGIKTAIGRTSPHVLVFDEPDIGLSEEYQSAVGAKFREFGEDLPEMTKAFGVVTHSRRLIKQLLPLKPHHVRFGDSLSLEDLVAREPEEYGSERLNDLRENGITTMRELSKLINSRPRR